MFNQLRKVFFSKKASLTHAIGKGFFSKTLFNKSSEDLTIEMGIEEDTYSNIFQALKHPIRRRILRMLKEQPLTYTEILNELGVDNGLLNYHLENLRELLAKGEDEKYRLSEFGKAGLSVIERVETPKDSYVKPRYLRIDSLPGILIIILLFSSALINVYYYIDNKNLKSENLQLSLDQNDAQNNYNVIADKLKNCREILNTSLLGFSSSIWRLKTMDFYRWNTTYPPTDFGQPVSVIYIFKNNSTLVIDLKIQRPDGFYVPLTIQKGNAFSYYDATVSIPDSNLKYAPILYSYNISVDKKIEVPLIEKGWYTVSLTGKWTFNGGTDDVGVFFKDHDIVVLPFRVNVDISVRSASEEYDFFAYKHFITYSIP